MAVLEAILRRYSCRSYEEKAVEQAKLDIILEAGRLAPSAKNLQDWRFVVVTEKEKKNEIVQSTNKPDVFGKAGVIIAACSNSDEVMSCGQAVGPIDVSIALEHIALQAAQLGLGTCWIGSFQTEVVRAALGIPADAAIIELMTIGYPAEAKKAPVREPIEKIVCYEKWQF